MRVLVTGGAGYIGSQTCKALACYGYEPVVFDNFSTGHRWAVRWGPVWEGDLSECAAIGAALEEYRPIAVIHFAASAYVRDSMRMPAEYFRNNCVNTLNLLDAMIGRGVDTIILSSTCAIYGTPTVVPIPASHPQYPVNPYGESKLFVERAVKWYGRAYGLRSVALRYFNAAGADPSGEIGEQHDPETHLIPLAIRAAAGKSEPLRVFGREHPTKDGTCIRDYVHVEDLATAHIKALDALRDGRLPVTSALNVGTGRGHSVLDVVRAVEEVSGLRVPVSFVEQRAGDPAVLVADASDAQAWDWIPRWKDLHGIVSTAWRWHSEGERLGAAAVAECAQR